MPAIASTQKNKRILSQFMHLNSLPPNNSPQRKQRWEELRKAVGERLSELNEQADSLKRQMAKDRMDKKNRFPKIWSKVPKETKERAYRLSLERLRLRVQIAEIELLNARAQGLKETSSAVTDLKEKLAFQKDALESLENVSSLTMPKVQRHKISNSKKH